MSDESFIEEDNDFIGTKDFDNICDNLISKVPVDNHREAYSVIYGHYKG
jgi:hypothetical protein